MSNAAIDYEKQEALNVARMQPLKNGDFDVQQNEKLKNDHFRIPQRRTYTADTDNETKAGNNRFNHSDRLNRVRAGLNDLKNAKNLAQDVSQMATPMGALSVFKQIDFLGDIPYFLAIGAAALKDASDLVLVGSLPGLGTIISICASIFIFMMMLLVGAGEKRKMAMSMIKRGMVIFGATLLEFIPGLNFVPIETIAICIVYFMTLSERKHLQK